MKNNVNPNMTSFSDISDDCLTLFGKFLQVTTIDETLQLINIFLGYMAFTGSRPLIYASEDKIMIDRRKDNGSIKLIPRLSGYAQIHQRGKLNPRSKAEYVSYYYQHLSLWLDIKILIYSIFKMFGAVKGK